MKNSKKTQLLSCRHILALAQQILSLILLALAIYEQVYNLHLF